MSNILSITCYFRDHTDPAHVLHFSPFRQSFSKRHPDIHYPNPLPSTLQKPSIGKICSHVVKSTRFERIPSAYVCISRNFHLGSIEEVKKSLFLANYIYLVPWRVVTIWYYILCATSIRVFLLHCWTHFIKAFEVNAKFCKIRQGSCQVQKYYVKWSSRWGQIVGLLI